MFKSIFGGAEIQEVKPRQRIVPTPTRKLSTCTSLIFLFFISCFICLAYIVIRENKTLHSIHNSFNVIHHQRIRKVDPAKIEQSYVGKIFNVEDIELNPSLSMNRTKKAEEDPGELLWKQFSKHADVVMKQVKVEQNKQKESVADEEKKKKLLDKTLND